MRGFTALPAPHKELLRHIRYPHGEMAYPLSVFLHMIAGVEVNSFRHTAWTGQTFYETHNIEYRIEPVSH